MPAATPTRWAPPMHSSLRFVLIALTAATSLLLAGTASMARADGISHPAIATQRAMATAEQIALQTWGTAACGGQVTVAWTALAPQVNANSRWSNPGDPYSAPAENSACHVDFNTLAHWDWPKLCTVVVHELGHLTGHRHSSDPANVMAPFYTKPLRACDTPGPGQPAVAPGTAAASKTTATTTLSKSGAARPGRHKSAPKTETARSNTGRSTKRRAKAHTRRLGTHRGRTRRGHRHHRHHLGRGA